MPYITYWVAENPCGASGVLATVIMAMVTNRYGHFFIRSVYTSSPQDLRAPTVLVHISPELFVDAVS